MKKLLNDLLITFRGHSEGKKALHLKQLGTNNYE
jgi:hypothetical protein